MNRFAKKLAKRVVAFQKENQREMEVMHRRFEKRWQETDPDVPHVVLKKRNQD